jgi:hypothetical protein
MPLVLKCVMASRDDDYDVLADGEVVGRLTKAAAAPEDRTPTHGYEATREAAMAAFAKSWRRES